MKRNWKPGDVAMVRLDESTEVRVTWTGDSWSGIKGGLYDPHLSARPLVVIDPEDREQVERVVAAFQNGAPGRIPWADLYESARVNLVDDFTTALREFASPTPPKPDEPKGLGAVVECEDGATWVRTDLHAKNNWVHAGFGSRSSYADIAAVRVLSEGVA